MTLQLYDYELDEDGYKVRLGLGMLGLSWRTIAVDMFPGCAQTKPPLIELNPRGTLPILVDGAVTLSDPQAILVYLARAYDPGGTWLPADAQGVAETVQWLAFAARDLNSATLARRCAIFGVPGDAEALGQSARRALCLMEDHMVLRGFSGGAWFVGDAATVADIALFPAFALSRDHGIDHEAYPALRRWSRRVRALTGFRTMPGIPDYH